MHDHPGRVAVFPSVAGRLCVGMHDHPGRLRVIVFHSYRTVMCWYA